MSQQKQKLVGKLVYWSEPRGFAFVRRVEGEFFVKYFMHVSDIMSGEPKVGATVRFHAVETPKGLAAVNCEIENDDDAVSAAAEKLAGGAA